MPHQCLKCGKVFPSGSPEILKGCANCGGKKFFYTEQPVSDDERERLTEQANKDIKVLIHEILTQREGEPIKTYDSEGQEVTAGKGLSTPAAGWVKFTPSKEGAKVEGAVEGEAKEMAPETKPGAAVHPSVKELLKELQKKPELGLELTETGKPGEPQIVKTRPKKKGKVKLKRRTRKGLRKTTHRPEVIRVVEPGVYEIYLSKLLKNFPIIINRDGTYLVHLPSVFESMDKEKK
ncbi:OapC/ArvC family zinc-ribbon domain-containing protein [[Eubacterium] cellulosolvens]